MATHRSRVKQADTTIFNELTYFSANATQFKTPLPSTVSTPDDSLFSSPSAVSDIALIVDGRKLHVSRCVLGLASSVFLKMFEGDFKDKTEIPLADKKYEDMVELLLCIYPSCTKLITENNLEVVLPLADEYQIESLKVRCEAFILNLFQLKEAKYHDPPNKELVHYLYLADKYRLQKLLDACINKVKFRTQEGVGGIKCIPEFQLMTTEVKFRVLSERMAQLEVPVKDMIIQGGNTQAGSLLNPSCAKCLYGVSSNHEASNACRVKVSNDVTALLAKLCQLKKHFHKDPNLA